MRIIICICVFILPVLYLNVPAFREHVFVTESLVLSVLSILLLFTIVLSKTKKFSLTSFDIAAFVLLLYIMVRSTTHSPFDGIAIAKLAFLLQLYTSMTALLNHKSYNLYYRYIIITVVMIFLVYFFLLLITYSSKFSLPDNFFLPNTSIFGILVAAQLSLLLPAIFSTASNFKKRLGLYSIFLIGLLVLTISNARSGWLGFAAACIFVIYNNFPLYRKWMSIVITTLVLILFPLAFYYKAASSHGRMLIYKISAQLFKDNWLWGIGNGRFKVLYNQYQANYFSQNNIDSKEALLADNTFYAFNDIFQFIIENGIIGCVLLAITIYLFIQMIKRLLKHTERSSLLIASTTFLICILTASLFSYPFQLNIITLPSIFCLAIVNHYHNNRSIRTNFLNFKWIAVILSILLIVHFYLLYQYKSQMKEAAHFSRIGFKTKALAVYAKLNNSYIKDGAVLLSYTRELYNVNQLEIAKRQMVITKKYICTNEVHTLSANISNELNEYSKAEKEYRQSVFMVPNRMKNRLDLLNYYILKKDSSNILYWANSILNMPVKVPSPITDKIQSEVARIIATYKH